MAAGFLRIPPHQGLCWDENSKDLRKTLNENSTLIANQIENCGIAKGLSNFQAVTGEHTDHRITYALSII
jgi:hypothetical protein